MINSAIAASDTGLQAANTFLDVVGNNIANLTTTGFKTAAVSFQDLLYIGPSAAGAPGQIPPEGTQIGAGTALTSVTTVFTPGQPTQTGRDLDLAISGNGFFAVTFPDGTTGYTRAGNFTTDAAGQLVTPDGFIVAPGITIPAGATNISFSADGTVSATVSGVTQTLGQLTLTTFPNPAGLLRVGDTAFAESVASGAAVTAVPGTQGLGTVSQGVLEGSNVDVAAELVNLLLARNTFTYNSRALVTEDNVLAATLDIV